MADRVNPGNSGRDMQTDRAARRQRCSFSCSDDVWDAAKAAWARQRRNYWVWTEWLEEAIEEKIARTKEQLGIDTFDPAPTRLPPGRRPDSDAPYGRKRRSFTCVPEVWNEAKDVWWAQVDDYPMWTDWLEDALAEKAERSQDQTDRAAKPHHQPT